MLELLSDPAVWAAFGTLTVMEIVLGIDNIVFISVLVSRLPKEQADRARSWVWRSRWCSASLLLLVICAGSSGSTATLFTAVRPWASRGRT